MATSDESSDHVVIEMAQLSLPTGDGDSTPVTRETPAQQKLPKAALTLSAVLSPDERADEFDQDMLRRAIADTGRWAYGTISVEAWVFSKRTGTLVRPKRAFWFDPVAVGEGNEAMMRLVDDGREDFVRPDPLAPGVGLAGALWTELGRRDNRMSAPRGLSVRNISIPKNIAWREVEPIANDPDQPFNLRLQLLAQAGIGLAAGVQFQFRGTQGLVVYMARTTTDVAKLKSATNEHYLLSAADVIGSIAALKDPRHACLEARRADRDSAWIAVRSKMIAFVRLGGSFLREKVEDDGESKALGKSTGKGKSPVVKPKLQNQMPVGNFVKERMMLVARKWRGSNNEPPPPFQTRESIFSFVGSFLTLLMLLYFSDAITKRNPEYSLVMGPFGALMTLQYNLTAAPASQPRNAILGQTLSLAIALGMTYTSLATNVRKALGTALAIMVMARLGITHPPAGAAALLFTGGQYSWGHMGIMLAGNILAIFSATVINDMNVKRQYPTFWGFGYWHKHFLSEGKEKKTE